MLTLCGADLRQVLDAKHGDARIREMDESKDKGHESRQSFDLKQTTFGYGLLDSSGDGAQEGSRAVKRFPET